MFILNLWGWGWRSYWDTRWNWAIITSSCVFPAVTSQNRSIEKCPLISSTWWWIKIFSMDLSSFQFTLFWFFFVICRTTFWWSISGSHFISYTFLVPSWTQNSSALCKVLEKLLRDFWSILTWQYHTVADLWAAHLTAAHVNLLFHCIQKDLEILRELIATFMKLVWGNKWCSVGTKGLKVC